MSCPRSRSMSRLSRWLVNDEACYAVRPWTYWRRTHVAQIGLAAMLLTIVSCATVVRGTTQPLTVVSEPEGAIVSTSNGLTGTTPVTFIVSRKHGFTVHFEKEGYEPLDTWVRTSVRGSGGAALAGNILARA